jgi:hypothetical protein
MSDEFAQVISDTHAVVTTNAEEWAPRYRRYIGQINAVIPLIGTTRKKFRAWGPLEIHMTVGNAATAKKASDLVFQLRYNGQVVGRLQYKEKNGASGKVWLEIDKESKSNEEHFEYVTENKKPVEWDSPEGKRFRKHFLDRENSSSETSKRKQGKEEHRLESRLLTEFRKKVSGEKALVGIQPVMLGGIFFSMPTPLKASGEGVKPAYSGNKGGGIDILARKIVGGVSCLHVIELKDENKSSEPPGRVVRQAIKYAVFIRELLRGDEGQKWWELFGFKKLPDSLSITAMTFMPAAPAKKDNDFSFCGKRYPLPGPKEDFIRLDAAYFIEHGPKLTIIPKDG